MTQDDRMETITDPAVIRACDEPDERGDFPCCTAPAPVGAAVALDLDALHETICDKFTGMAEVRQAADLLVAEVRSLRAKVAAVEAVEDSWSRRTLPWPAWPHVHHWLRDLRAALATTGEVQ